MKKLILFAILLSFLAACNQTQRYTQSSPEIDAFKAVIENYNNQDWAAMTAQYADSAKTYNNSSDYGLSLFEMIAYHKDALTNLADRKFLKKDQEYEMVLTDDGETWVNFWGDWEGTLKANGKKIKIPIHLTARFVDGKIIRTSGNWDNSPIILELQAIDAKNDLSPEDNRAIINGMYEAFATGDVPTVLGAMNEHVIWNEAEGNSLAKGNPYKSPDAVLKGVFTPLTEEWENFRLADIKLHEMSNDKVLATLRYHGKFKKTGKSINAQAAHLWKLENGKVISFQQYVDTKQLAEAENN